MTSGRINLTSGQKVGVMAMVIIAALTTLIDFVFHALATSPMEITTYFLAIFMFALVGAALIPEYGVLVGAFVFTTLKLIYNLFAVIFSASNLTILTSSGGMTVLGVPFSTTNFLTNINAYILGGIFYLGHAIFFLVAAAIVLGSRKGR